MAQLVEHDLAKVGAAGSSPVSRSSVEKQEALICKVFFFCCSVKVDYSLLFKIVCPEAKIFSFYTIYYKTSWY